MCRLQHPHVLPLLDAQLTGDRAHLVMPLVEGESLADLLDRRGPLPGPEAARYALAVAGLHANLMLFLLHPDLIRHPAGIDKRLRRRKRALIHCRHHA